MIKRVEDIPESALRPVGWDQWRVVAYRGKSGDIRLGETFVRAGTETQACKLGKEALRMTGVRGKYVVNASPYYPWRDISFAGFIGFAS